MRSHFLPNNPNPEQRGPSLRRSVPAAIAFALSGATVMLTGVCSAQIALDSASDPAYAGGWSAGQNGGYGFGAWSFYGTDATPAGQYQGISTSSPLGTSWTLLSHDPHTGLANAGRSINGGLQAGQTFEATLENPTAYNFYRGFDILFTSGPDNNPGGVNTAALRLSVFDYFGSNWSLNDTGSTSTSFASSTTGASGMKLDLTLTSPTAYSLTLTPLNGATPYTHAGTLAGPISWVDFRLYDGASAGLTDTANNFEISSMSVSVPEPSTLALLGLSAAGLAFFRRRQ